jgi:tetratricopeptide (TPR) repeat protein
MQYTGDEVFDRIEVLCEQGEVYIERGKYRSALQKFWKAFDLLPEPKSQYPSGTWLLTAIGDLNFFLQNYQAGVKNLTNAKNFFQGDNNGFISFRLGQCQFELGNLNEAIIELNHAFDLEGTCIFEDEDPKYLTFFNKKNII